MYAHGTIYVGELKLDRTKKKNTDDDDNERTTNKRNEMKNLLILVAFHHHGSWSREVLKCKHNVDGGIVYLNTRNCDDNGEDKLTTVEQSD